MTTPPHTPPMAASNEAEPDQLGVARAEGDAYARALEVMDEESGAVIRRAGDYLVAFVQENAEGMYELADGRLVWREAPEEANAHLEIAVADAADGRFVPALDITVTLIEGDRELFTTPMPFLHRLRRLTGWPWVAAAPPGWSGGVGHRRVGRERGGGRIGRGGRGRAALDGAGQQEPGAADLGPLAQPPAAVLPAGQPLPLQPAGGQGGVLAGHRQRRPVLAGTAAAAEPEHAVGDPAEEHPVAARVGLGLDQDRPVGQDPGVVALLDRANFRGQPVQAVPRQGFEHFFHDASIGQGRPGSQRIPRSERGWPMSRRRRRHHGRRNFPADFRRRTRRSAGTRPAANGGAADGPGAAATREYRTAMMR
jgi:hypothetical protein